MLITFVISCERELSTSPPDEEPPKGILKIESIPPGYQIWVNGKNTGRITPDSLPFIEPKQYQITLKKYRWKDTTFSITAYEEFKNDTLINYLTNPSMYGSIIIRSDPNFSFYKMHEMDRSGITPDTIKNLLPGRYQAVLSHEGFRTDSLLFDVFSSKATSSLLKLRDTTIWVDLTKWTSTIPSNNLSTIRIDENNIKWIGTTDKGLIKMEGNSFTLYDPSNSMLPGKKINVIEVAPDNSLWVGTDYGFVIIKDNIWELFNSDNNLPANTITSFVFLDDGTVTIGTSNGVSTKTGNEFVSNRVVQSTTNPVSINHLYVDKEKTMWIGTSGYGLYKYKNGRFTEEFDWTKNPYQSSNLQNAPSREVTSFTEDKNGYLWVASNFEDTEVYVTPPGRYVRLTKRGGVSMRTTTGLWVGNLYIVAPNVIYSMSMIDEQIWVCTREGLNIHEDIGTKQVIRKTFDGLTSDNVSGVAKDKDGIFWITTLGGGLNKYKR